MILITAVCGLPELLGNFHRENRAGESNAVLEDGKSFHSRALRGDAAPVCGTRAYCICRAVFIYTWQYEHQARYQHCSGALPVLLRCCMISKTPALVISDAHQLDNMLEFSPMEDILPKLIPRNICDFPVQL